MIKTAIKIVTAEFSNKYDLNGLPYIFHLHRVASHFKENETLQTIAYLHDLFEDCDDWDYKRLYKLIPNATVCDAVEVLTKKIDYESYIKSVAKNEYARQVKIADLKDNMDITRFRKQLSDKDIERLKKYHKAYLYLSAY